MQSALFHGKWDSIEANLLSSLLKLTYSIYCNVKDTSRTETWMGLVADNLKTICGVKKYFFHSLLYRTIARIVYPNIQILQQDFFQLFIELRDENSNTWGVISD